MICPFLGTAQIKLTAYIRHKIKKNERLYHRNKTGFEKLSFRITPKITGRLKWRVFANAK